MGGKPIANSSDGKIKRSLLEQDTNLILEDQRTKVLVQVADSWLEPKKFTWQSLPSTFTFNNVRFHTGVIIGELVYAGERFPSSVNLMPFIGKQALAPLGFNLRHRGQIQAITKRIYTQQGKELRLIVTGDLSSITEETTGELRFDGEGHSSCAGQSVVARQSIRRRRAF